MELPFSYTLIRARRKTVQLRVGPDGQVILRAPQAIRRAQADAIVLRHQDWIQAQIARQQARQARRRILSETESAALRAQAQAVLPARTADWAKRMGVCPAGVRITSAARRWGSCSAQDQICYSFRVMLLPEALQEYIIVHELAHIRHKNHSAAFYAEGSRFLPDFCARRQALRAWEAEHPLG